MGLAIVDTVTVAHARVLTITPGRAGGLRVEVRIPLHRDPWGEETGERGRIEDLPS